MEKASPTSLDVSEPIDIDRLTEDELRALNGRIVERIRALQQARRQATMLQFAIGERVCFQPQDERQIYGTITKYNRKTVTVATPQGRWRVGPSMLRKVATQVAEAQLAPGETLVPQPASPLGVEPAEAGEDLDSKLQLRLSARKRQLVSEFGYAFPDVQKQLDRLAHDPAEGVVYIDGYFFDLLLADLSRSQREVRNRRLFAELDELYDELESQAGEQGHIIGQ